MKIISNICFAILACVCFGSCSHTVSYAELLNREENAVNNFLADQTVCLDIPADTIFQTGPNAPYYRIDSEGNLYMQVLKAGTPGNRVKSDEQIYFRYTRYALEAYVDGTLPQGEGNNISLSPCWFRYNNYSLQNSYKWGTGIQAPLKFLPIDCEVNLVVKAAEGFVEEQANVQPYLFKLTYQRRE